MINLSNIKKSFDGRVVLSDISLSVEKNEFVCLTGESGAGKTTLLNIIGLLDKPDSGEISLHGKTNFSRKEILRLRRYFFGYVFQDYLLMQDETVDLNINISKMYNKQLSDKHKNEVMERVGLDASYLNRKVCHLSGGEQQRVALARMMLKPYELVLADEPTGNLDDKNKREVIRIFKDIKEYGKTIICVTHDKEFSDSSDRTINLKKCL
ncbi:putative ABC transport system ATP-binding protein [Anaerovirgula multivorans]|uniref:Putative ABC transport system ATP-binding protein n=1 Tax=Anaerovirgula multivorans TaxID=312168 RepID=A0A239L529_9FIRM|nr:ATP-binding cassette domain-containing protein [Anaerovirgula multivorans]SNT25706.1 putative ABC transport system ATP-binding protein [Anaerovirgula multivorans]